MLTTRVFKSGNSLAVRLPKELMFSDSEPVEIIQRGNDVIIRRRQMSLKDAFNLLTDMPDDFMTDDREDLPPQERDF